MVTDLLAILRTGVAVPSWKRGLTAGAVLSVPKSTDASIRVRLLNEAGDPQPIGAGSLRLAVHEAVVGCDACATSPVLSVTATALPECGPEWAAFTITPAMTRNKVAKRYRFAVAFTSESGAVDAVVPQSTFILSESP